MSNTDAVRHPARPSGVSEAPTVCPMKTEWLDRLALARIVEGEPAMLGKLWAVLDEAMNGLYREPEAARLRLLARTIALLHAKVEVLEGIADNALVARDFAAVAVTQKVLDATARRLAALLAEHRLATQAERRSVAVSVVSQNAQVNVQAARQGG